MVIMDPCIDGSLQPSRETGYRKNIYTYTCIVPDIYISFLIAVISDTVASWKHGSWLEVCCITFGKAWW